MQIDWANFTALDSTIGGALIGLAAVLLMAFNGRIMGISGIAGAALGTGQGRRWRLSFLIGVILGPVLFTFINGPVDMQMVASLPVLGVAGLLVGIGTALGSGCTSGHGICGISRFSVRSIGATISFVATGMITVFVIGLF
ncbi:MAG: YeeE/YedE family protein [Candidatus Puniceispirillaceae bacterium]